ncbi:mitochondrial substrate carrier [Volvox carteri f. nagariensis]|uniref:Mitochondrial substrate carrier n=1 Tax=Volvox carteri f. nagariensis TaxID=3068 RepID=D8TSH1_VOLCA|nr:mitochondrial substrate carrier [Volvox carteri f. nagariensis]EFJ49371.1 mitochondrial substrate carrier [Volvox carteri f. nagariensis]|eukprot:XP_002949352.1 mitochondrial substrate carrier [Volvox carteri f. nagariensis]
MGSQAEEVDWDRLDKNKFFLYGAGMFSGVTLTLYPLSVIKTKQMTLPGISGGFQGVKQTASTIMRIEGIPGFYRGFGTVMFGTIPARSVYLTTLEWTKSEVAKVVGDLGLTGPVAAGVANFAGGAVASLATQSVTVPIDVISQKQMMVRLILKEEGIGGLYRGFGASVATFVPSSAVWWGAYGTYQKLIWALRYHSPGEAGGGVAAAAAVAVPGDGAAATAVPGGQPPVGHSTGEVVAVQTLSSVLAGFTSGLLTTPVDLVKPALHPAMCPQLYGALATRIQVSYKHDGATPTFGEVARQIMREDGVGGFLRGAVPRMLNASLWGTCMVTVYEYLKRTCAKADET